MKKSKYIFCFLLLTGCAFLAERKELRINYDLKYEYTIEKNYQETYQLLLEKMRDRYTIAWVGNRGIVENDFFPDNKTATIRGSFWNDIFGEYTPMLIEIEGTSDDVSIVVVYSSKKGIDTPLSKKEFEAWIR